MKPPLNMWNFCKHTSWSCHQLSNSRLIQMPTASHHPSRGMASKSDLDPSSEKQKIALEEYRRSRPYSEAFTGMKLDEPSVFSKLVNSIKPLNFIKDTEWTLQNFSHIMKNTKRNVEINSQRFDTVRYETLGFEIGAAHFVVYRKGAIKFYNQENWIRWTTEAKYSEVAGLPFLHEPGYHVEAIDMANVTLHYEGLKNFEPLKRLRHLNLENSAILDDWYLDVISNFTSLEYLGLRNCPLVTHRGIAILHKLSNLKTLEISVDKESPSKEMQLAVLNLLDHLPELNVDIDPTETADSSSAISN